MTKREKKLLDRITQMSEASQSRVREVAVVIAHWPFAVPGWLRCKRSFLPDIKTLNDRSPSLYFLLVLVSANAHFEPGLRKLYDL